MYLPNPSNTNLMWQRNNFLSGLVLVVFFFCFCFFFCEIGCITTTKEPHLPDNLVVPGWGLEESISAFFFEEKVRFYSNVLSLCLTIQHTCFLFLSLSLSLSLSLFLSLSLSLSLFLSLFLSLSPIVIWQDGEYRNIIRRNKFMRTT